jgi:hypothetical protein
MALTASVFQPNDIWTAASPCCDTPEEVESTWTGIDRT